MAKERTITPRTILVMILAGCVFIFVGSRLQNNGGKSEAPKTSVSQPTQTPVIDELCSQVKLKVRNTADPQKYITLCSKAREAWSKDQTDVCASKLKQLGKLLNTAKIASIPDVTVARACKPQHIEV